MTTDPAPGTPTSPRTVYLVLGMHRSGTSATTQLLALAGAQLPDNVMPGDEHNAKGYFEPWRIAVFNDKRLRAGGGAWDDAFAYPYVEVVDEADWREQARQLIRVLGEHILREETDLFPAAHQLLTPAQWDTVAAAHGSTASIG